MKLITVEIIEKEESCELIMNSFSNRKINVCEHTLLKNILWIPIFPSESDDKKK
jgi:hypothetical protein